MTVCFHLFNRLNPTFCLLINYNKNSNFFHHFAKSSLQLHVSISFNFGIYFNILLRIFHEEVSVKTNMLKLFPRYVNNMYAYIFLKKAAKYASKYCC